MSETKWTPGNWSVTEWRDEDEDMAGFKVAVDGYLVPTCTYDGEYEEAKANVTLWSAAPDLYEALEEVLRHASFPPQEMQADPDEPFPAHSAVIKARAALAKARGE